MVALTFGATFATWTLEAFTDIAAIVCRYFELKMRSNDIATVGGALFMHLIMGMPAIAMASGFATGQLPAKP